MCRWKFYCNPRALSLPATLNVLNNSHNFIALSCTTLHSFDFMSSWWGFQELQNLPNVGGPSRKKSDFSRENWKFLSREKTLPNFFCLRKKIFFARAKRSLKIFYGLSTVFDFKTFLHTSRGYKGFFRTREARAKNFLHFFSHWTRGWGGLFCQNRFGRFWTSWKPPYSL